MEKSQSSKCITAQLFLECGAGGNGCLIRNEMKLTRQNLK